jgi:hypothetical protein
MSLNYGAKKIQSPTFNRKIKWHFFYHHLEKLWVFGAIWKNLVINH